MTWFEFLGWLLTTEGINAVIGVVLSFVVEWFPEFEFAQPRTKRLVMLLLCLLIPSVGATLLWAGGYREPSWEQLYWPALRSGAVAYMVSQAVHARQLANTYPTR